MSFKRLMTVFQPRKFFDYVSMLLLVLSLSACGAAPESVDILAIEEATQSLSSDAAHAIDETAPVVADEVAVPTVVNESLVISDEIPLIVFTVAAEEVAVEAPAEAPVAVEEAVAPVVVEQPVVVEEAVASIELEQPTIVEEVVSEVVVVEAPVVVEEAVAPIVVEQPAVVEETVSEVVVVETPVIVEEAVAPIMVEDPVIIVESVSDVVVVEAPVVVEEAVAPIVVDEPTVVEEAISEVVTSDSSVVVVDEAPVVEVSVLTEMVISPFLESISKGSQSRFTATGIYSDLANEDLSAVVTWSVDNTSIGAIDEAGTVSALEAGRLKITASYQGIYAQKILNVTPATLDSIQIVPSQLDIASGLQQVFKAVGNYSDGSIQDVTDQVVWTSSDSHVVSLSGATSTAQAQGQAVISAALDDVSAQADVAVNPAILQRVEVSSPSLVLETGVKVSLKVLAFYSDQRIHDVSAQVDWMVDDASVASIDSVRQQVLGLTPGRTMLRTLFGGFSAQTSLQVNAAVLSRIEISPATATTAAGYQQVFKATGIYSNQQSQDLTQQVTWTSSNATVAGIDNRQAAKGLASGFSAGTASISASFEGQAASAHFIVSDAELINIEVTPSGISLAKGLQQQFQAIAFYSDGSQKSVSEQVRWSSDSHRVSLVGSQSAGLFQANTTGTVSVIATLNNQQGYTRLEVSDAILDSLVLMAENDRLPVGTRQRLSAFGHYTDGSSVDLSQQVSWNSSSAQLAHVSNAVDSKGLLTGMATGNVTIAARLGDVQATNAIEISAAVLQQITLYTSSEPLYIHQNRQIESVGIYSDGSQQGLNDRLHWYSSDESVVAVSNTRGSEGVLMALAAGQVEIQASLSGVTSERISLNAIDNPNRPASLSIQSSPNVILNDGVDSSRISARVKPLQQQGVVADGTMVNFIVVENSVTRIVSTQTIGGVASIDLQSIESGLISVTAELEDTELNATSAIYSTDNFARVLQVLPLSRVSMANNNTFYLKGSVFGVYLRNLSNRDFALLAFQMKNGTEYLPGLPVTESSYLSGGLLEGGEYTGAAYSLDSDTPNHGFSAGYILGDASTQRVFGFSVGFNPLP